MAEGRASGDRDGDIGDGGGAPAGRPEEPGRLWEPSSPGVGGGAPTAVTHSSRRQDHAPPAARPDPWESSASPRTAANPEPPPFKDSVMGVALRAPPRPAPPRRTRPIPGPALDGRGSLARGLLAERLQAGGRETKGRIPPLPAVSRPPGIFPRPGTLPPALPLSLLTGSGSFQK